MKGWELIFMAGEAKPLPWILPQHVVWLFSVRGNIAITIYCHTNDCLLRHTSRLLSSPSNHLHPNRIYMTCLRYAQTPNSTRCGLRLYSEGKIADKNVVWLFPFFDIIFLGTIKYLFWSFNKNTFVWHMEVPSCGWDLNNTVSGGGVGGWSLFLSVSKVSLKFLLKYDENVSSSPQ